MVCWRLVQDHGGVLQACATVSKIKAHQPRAAVAACRFLQGNQAADHAARAADRVVGGGAFVQAAKQREVCPSALARFFGHVGTKPARVDTDMEPPGPKGEAAKVSRVLFVQTVHQ